MNKIIFVLISLMVLTIKASEFTKIQCIYKIYNYKVVGNIYYCWIKNDLRMLTAKEAYIKEATGTHEGLKSDGDVKGVWVRKQVVHYFPRGLNKIYSNLELIYILNSGLREIHQSDLKPFTKLFALDLSLNEIQIIEEDLFRFNTKLKYISFSNNKIYHIQPNVFHHLVLLEHLNLAYNECTFGVDADNVFELIDSIKDTCLSYYYKLLNEKIKMIELATLILNQNAYNEKVKMVENQIKSSKFSHFESFKKVIANAKNLKAINGTFTNINLDETTEISDYS